MRPRLALSAVPLATFTTATLAAPPVTVPADIPPAPTLTVPKGGYETAWLTLDGGPSPVTAFVAFRDGKPVTFWTTASTFPGLPAPADNPKLLTDALRGTRAAGAYTAEIDLRLVSVWAPMKRLGTTTLTLSFTTADGKVAGTWSTKGDVPASGSVTGTLLDEPAAKAANGIAPGQDWPSFYGTLSALRAPDYKKPLIGDMARARPVWRSEVVSLSGWGTGVDGRYKTRAAYGTLCGGSSSPVVADGLVYLYHYRPTEPSPEDVDADVVDKFKDNPREFDAVRRFFSKRADLIVTAVDAATGKTVWESVWPNKQGNYQTHKWRANNPTPTLAKGTLVVADYSWGLHAYDAKTGELKWTRGGGGPVPHDHGAVGPVISGDTVVWATGAATLGLDLATGKERWRAPAAGSARRMVVDGAERVLLVDATLTLIDPASGRTLAAAPFPGEGTRGGPRGELGRGTGDNLVCDGPYIVSFRTHKGEKPARGQIFALKIAGDMIAPAWESDVKAEMEDGHTCITIARGFVYTGFKTDGAYCLDLATGKTVTHLPEFTVHSNPVFVTVDDRVLWQPECQHGRQSIQLMAGGPDFRPLGVNWRPPHNDTTAYGEMPIANVTVDGRLLVRGMDGIYCYDMRKKD